MQQDELHEGLEALLRLDVEGRIFPGRPYDAEHHDRGDPRAPPQPAPARTAQGGHGSAGRGSRSGAPRAGTMAMQSTGQGGMQSSQPVHQSAMTVCINLLAPTIASTGQAWMHLVQPMHTSSSITATRGGVSVPQAGSSGNTGCPVIRASARTPSSPPGEQRLIAASPRATASAYGRQAG